MSNIKVLNPLIHDSLTASRALKLDSSKVIGSGTPTDTELGYLSGVTSAIQTQFTNRCNPSQRIANALGSAILAGSGDFRMIQNNIGAWTDQRFHVVAIWLERDATLTGVKWYQQTAGVYTGDQNNKIGLYTYSGGTLTLVASCANDANLWKATSQTWTSKAFSSTYAASAGLFFVGYLYNQSAQTTSPAIATLGNYANNTLVGDFTNSAKWSAFLNAQNDLPASQAMSGMTVETVIPYFALY